MVPNIPVPTYRFLAIPTPPFTTKAPVDVLVESVALVIDVAPLIVNPVRVPREVILV